MTVPMKTLRDLGVGFPGIDGKLLLHIFCQRYPTTPWLNSPQFRNSTTCPKTNLSSSTGVSWPFPSEIDFPLLSHRSFCGKRIK